MAKFPISSSTCPFHLLFLHLLALSPISSLSLLNPTFNNPNFDPQIAILGDAEITGNGTHVQLTRPLASSSGLLVYKSPFKFLQSSPNKMVSFSTEFSFSLTGNGNGLSLVMGPYNFASKFLGQGPFGVLSEKGCLGIEFDTSVDSNVDDFNASLVAVSLSSVSSLHLVTNSGEKLKSWVDYDATSKRLEVRLSKLGDKRPYSPIIAYSIDLSKLWGDNEVYVALGSFNGNASETCNLYSWRFRLRKVPNSMHSFPADPHGYMDEHNEDIAVHKRSFCPLTILAGMIFATGCGALLAFVVLFVWAIFVNSNTVFPIEGKDNARPVDFRYEKINVVVEKDAKVVKN